MRRKRTKSDTLPTIWRVPDDLWQKIQPLVEQYDPPKCTGRKRIAARSVLDAIIFRLRSGCQWNQLPSEFPDDSSVHRTRPSLDSPGTLRSPLGRAAQRLC